MNNVADASQRQQAINPEHSYIVQAPAGSGKTELLIQRYLTLLARVDKPENILSITFTKKAAAEMRKRIIDALRQAQNGVTPEQPHHLQTYTLAQAALQHCHSNDCNILEQPGRLRIQTIDSFCAGLVRSMPALSDYGALPDVDTDMNEAYRNAAKMLLNSLTDSEWQGSVRKLLHFLDNNTYLFEDLITNMLKYRDQWLRHIHNVHRETWRSELDDAFSVYIQSRLQKAYTLLNDSQQRYLFDTAKQSAGILRANGKASRILNLEEQHAFPEPHASNLPAYQGLCALLLTSKGEWLKRVTIAQGFVAASTVKNSVEKQACKDRVDAHNAFIAECANIQDLREVLKEIFTVLPDCRFTDDEWGTTEAIMKLLFLATAQLKTLFASENKIDFQEILLAALDALGHTDDPSSLLLQLDYSLKHILIDEYQDTSISQYILLEKLVSGWQHDDGRTLFLVGDPMQSIYRFRNAEVGLFLRAQENGVADIALTPLTLSVNFRSNQRIVEWVNSSFPQIMPQHTDIQTGAISYSHSVAFHDDDATSDLAIYAFDNSAEAEAHKVIDIIHQRRNAFPDETIAVLVRSKTHLLEILPLLQSEGIPIQAIDIDTMLDKQVVLDLVSLTAALHDLSDRIAWLSLLRAPWCGLTLNDLYIICHQCSGESIYEKIHDTSQYPFLSSHSQAMLPRLLQLVDEAVLHRDKKPLDRMVHAIWQQLGGPACVTAESDIELADVFFSILKCIEKDALIPYRNVLNQYLQDVYANSSQAGENPVQIMSIHKSKGLQFDTVIIPRAGRQPRRPDSSLILWEEVTEDIDNSLMLAPLSRKYHDGGKRYELLKHISNIKSSNELARLLYVAATRSKHALYITGEFKRDKNDEPTVASSTFLAMLWDMPGMQKIEATQPEATPDNDISEQKLQRLATEWQMPDSLPAISGGVETDTRQPADVSNIIEFDWATELAMQTGIIVHDYLCRFSRLDDVALATIDIKTHKRDIAHALREFGVQQHDIDKVTQRVVTALQNTLEDKTGRWLLSDKHLDAHSEYALTGIIDGNVTNIIIDRTFVDSDDVRWIVDYKTSRHEGADVEGFIDNEKLRYQSQLEKYASLIAHIDDRPVKKALYFPLLKRLVEWD